jgi:hypothetical protein
MAFAKWCAERSEDRPTASPAREDADCSEALIKLEACSAVQRAGTGWAWVCGGSPRAAGSPNRSRAEPTSVARHPTPSGRRPGTGESVLLSPAESTLVPGRRSVACSRRGWTSGNLGFGQDVCGGCCAPPACLTAPAALKIAGLTDREVSRSSVALTRRWQSPPCVTRCRPSSPGVRERTIAANPVTPARVPKSPGPRTEMLPLSEPELEEVYADAVERDQRLTDLLLIDGPGCARPSSARSGRRPRSQGRSSHRSAAAANLPRPHHLLGRSTPFTYAQLSAHLRHSGSPTVDPS